MKRKMNRFSGQLNETKFCSAEHVTEAFCVLDKDKDGYVSPAEFMLVMRVFGHKDMVRPDRPLEPRPDSPDPVHSTSDGEGSCSCSQGGRHGWGREGLPEGLVDILI